MKNTVDQKVFEVVSNLTDEVLKELYKAVCKHSSSLIQSSEAFIKVSSAYPYNVPEELVRTEILMEVSRRYFMLKKI